MQYAESLKYITFSGFHFVCWRGEKYSAKYGGSGGMPPQDFLKEFGALLKSTLCYMWYSLYYNVTLGGGKSQGTPTSV